MNKKAGLPDGFFLIVAFFAIAIIFIFMWVIISNVNTEFQDSDYITSEGKNISQSLTNRYVNLFDKAFLFIVLGLGFGVIAGAWFINSHPALFWISVPILAFTIFLGALFANIFTEIVANDEITTFADDFNYIPFIFDNFVVIITIFILLLALTLYAKPQRQQ